MHRVCDNTTKQSRAPSLCWPFITFPCKMTDKKPKTRKEGNKGDQLKEREGIKVRKDKKRELSKNVEI